MNVLNRNNGLDPNIKTIIIGKRAMDLMIKGDAPRIDLDIMEYENRIDSVKIAMEEFDQNKLSDYIERFNKNEQ